MSLSTFLTCLQEIRQAEERAALLAAQKLAAAAAEAEALRQKSLTWEDAVRAALSPAIETGAPELSRESQTLADILASGN